MVGVAVGVVVDVGVAVRVTVLVGVIVLVLVEVGVGAIIVRITVSKDDWEKLSVKTKDQSPKAAELKSKSQVK